MADPGENVTGALHSNFGRKYIYVCMHLYICICIYKVFATLFFVVSIVY